MTLHGTKVQVYKVVAKCMKDAKCMNNGNPLWTILFEAVFDNTGLEECLLTCTVLIVLRPACLQAHQPHQMPLKKNR